MKIYVQDDEKKPEVTEPPTSDVTDMPESEDIVPEDDDDDDIYSIDPDDEEDA